MVNIHVIGSERDSISEALERYRVVALPAREVFLRVFDCLLFNGGPDELYMLVFDTDAAPTGALTPCCVPVRVPAGSTASWSNTLGKRFRTGVCVAGSTSPTAYADPGETCWIEINYN